MPWASVRNVIARFWMIPLFVQAVEHSLVIAKHPRALGEEIYF